MIKQQPKEITVCHLECIVMPNGEIICMGKSIGWFREFGPHLHVAQPTKEAK